MEHVNDNRNLLQASSTKPQALIMLCMILIFILMALDVVMFSVVPDYTTYGSQHYAINVTVGNQTVTEVTRPLYSLLKCFLPM